jgi:PAS domain S-box-containing protein
LADLLPQVVFEADRKGLLTFANRQAFAMFGYTEADFHQGLTIFQMIAPDDRARARAEVARVLRGEAVPGVAYTALRKDGTIFPALVHAVPVLDQGHPVGLRGILIDLTDQAEREAALREREERYRVLFEMVSDALFLIDNAEGRILEVNPAASALYGYSRDELLARRNVDLSAEPAETRAATTSGRERVPIRFHRKKDGTVFAVEIAARHLVWRGRPAHLAAIRDITERLAAEAELRGRTEQLEAVRTVSAEIARELDLTAVLELINRRTLDLVRADGGAIYLWDETGQVLIPTSWRGFGDWMRQLRLRPGEGVTGTVAARREGLLVNDFRTSPYATPFWLERSPHVAALVEPLVYRDRLVGVHAVTRNDPAQPFTAADQHVLRLLATQAAIAIENAQLFTELDRSYRELQAAQARLIQTEKLRALGQLAAGVAHDLNNKLAALQGEIELLRLRRLHPGLHDSLQRMETAIHDGAQVVRRLRDFSRQDAPLPLVAMDLGLAVQDALDLTRAAWQDTPQQQGHAIVLERRLEDLPPILGHASEIRELLANLILNAVDAMPHGGILRVRGEVRPPGADSPGEVGLHLEDTGVGMSPEIQSRIFEPFFTTKGPRGTGLGLAMVYAAMQRHGGRIDVVSAPGVGTRFTLWFRQASRAPSPAPVRLPLRVVPRTILLIEDTPAVRHSTALLLRQAGHCVLEAAHGNEGLGMLARHPVDLVLTDLGMPGMSGREVARRVKALAPRLPVVLLTGWEDREEPTPGTPPAVDQVLHKPVRLEALLQTIADLTEPAAAGLGPEDASASSEAPRESP